MFYERLDIFYEKLVKTVLLNDTNKKVYLNIITLTSTKSTQLLEQLRNCIMIIQDSCHKHILKKDKTKGKQIIINDYYIYVLTNLVKMKTLLTKL